MAKKIFFVLGTMAAFTFCAGVAASIWDNINGSNQSVVGKVHGVAVTQGDQVVVTIKSSSKPFVKRNYRICQHSATSLDEGSAHSIKVGLFRDALSKGQAVKVTTKGSLFNPCIVSAQLSSESVKKANFQNLN